MIFTPLGYYTELIKECSIVARPNHYDNSSNCGWPWGRNLGFDDWGWRRHYSGTGSHILGCVAATDGKHRADCSCHGKRILNYTIFETNAATLKARDGCGPLSYT